MALAAAMIYWVVVVTWMTVLATVVIFYIRNKREFGTTRLLLVVIGIDTLRNIVENVYFGLYFGANYGFFPASLVHVLGKPALLILPKIDNVASGLVVLGLLLGRWLPRSLRERQVMKAAAESLEEKVNVDGMTGLLNRTHFHVLADIELSRCRRYRRPLSMLAIDIDHFKSINDRFGHDVGDRVIVQVADACRRQRRKSDIVARLGGEEFALLLPETNLEEAHVCAERLRETISLEVLALGGENVSVTVSCGISYASQSTSLAELFKEADVALYQAKRQGRNCVCLSDLRGSERPNARLAQHIPISST